MGWFDRWKRWRNEQANFHRACAAAKAQFFKEHPETQPPGSTAHLHATEAERYVVMVQWFTGYIPLNFCFYEVEKGSFSARLLLDDSQYRPKVRR